MILGARLGSSTAVRSAGVCIVNFRTAASNVVPSFCSLSLCNRMSNVVSFNTVNMEAIKFSVFC